MKCIPNVKVGRPRKYDSPEEILAAGEKFFDYCDAHDKPYTITGLALALGFTSRQDLINYSGYSEEFYDTIKSMKVRCEAYAEDLILQGKAQAGGIFVLKNHGWTDQHEITGPGGSALITEVIVKFVDANTSEKETG